MFWNKKTKVGYVSAPVYFEMPIIKKEIRVMRDILSDIQKYDDRNCIEVRNLLLTALSEQIEILRNKKANEPNRSI